MQTDRTSIELWQKCPRLRYWMREHEGRGLEPVNAALELAYGKAVHAGVEQLLLGKPLEPVISACQQAWRAASESELAWNGEGNLEYYDLLEGHLRLWYALAYPTLQGRIASVEREEIALFPPGTLGNDADFRFASRSDWITTDDLIYNLKTMRADTPKWRAQWEYDNQTLSELLGPEQRLGRKLRGVVIQGLVKENSPLVWVWRSTKTGELASRFSWTCDSAHVRDDGKFCAGGKQHRLGKGWQRIPVREVATVRENFERLQSDEPVLLREQLVELGPFMRRSDYEIESWKRQHLEHDIRVIKRGEWLQAVAKRDKERWQEELDRCFPQHQAHANCFWPRKCAAFDLCWGAAASDPFAHGYRWRTPNHPEELA